jgi:dihydroceramidase
MAVQGGYWEPHTSSVDFCEPNYYVTPYIVEFHNTWSSILITVLSVIGYTFGNPTSERRFSICYFIMGIVGIGSVGLHSTLHWIPQSSDELPMMWTSIAFLYVLCVMNEEKGSPRTRNAGVLFTSIAGMETLIYVYFRHIYAVFIVSFLLLSLGNTLWLSKLTFYDGDGTHRPIRAKLFTWAFVTFGILAAGVWIIDMHLCHILMPLYVGVGGMTLHVLWHLLSCFGIHLAIVLLTAIRIQVLQQEPELEFVYGFIPICKVTKKLYCA